MVEVINHYKYKAVPDREKEKQKRGAEKALERGVLPTCKEGYEVFVSWFDGMGFLFDFIYYFPDAGSLYMHPMQRVASANERGCGNVTYPPTCVSHCRAHTGTTVASLRMTGKGERGGEKKKKTNRYSFT
eukprot:gene6247-4496_t